MFKINLASENILAYAFDQSGSNLIVLSQKVKWIYTQDPNNPDNEISKKHVYHDKQIRIVDIKNEYEYEVLW